MADDQHTLDAQVLTPEGEVFSGDLKQLSTRTVVGEVGVLANHVPMLARLVPAELRLHVSESETIALRAGRGLARGVRQPGPGPGHRSGGPRQPRRRALKEKLADAEQA